MIHETKTYEIRNTGGCGYAFISLTDLKKDAGILSIVSDYGNWSYLWTSMGSDIRGFVSRISSDYLMGKLTMDNKADRDVFNLTKTVSNIKKIVIQYRKDGQIDDETAREAFDEIKEIESECVKSEDGFYHYFLETHALMKLFPDGDVPTVTEYSESLRRFVKDVWPVFIGILSEEATQ